MMKKIFLLLIMFPTFLFSQENMKKSAEDFVTGYFKLFEDLKWDKIPDMYADDAQIIWPNGKIIPKLEAMKPYMDKNKPELISLKIDVKWMLTDITGPNSAMVSTSYISTKNRSGNIEVKDNIEFFLLERKEDIWKIKKEIGNWNFPLVFSDNIDKKYQISNMSAIAKLDVAINQRWYAMYRDIEYFKNNGTSPSEYGKMLGKMYANVWDKSEGFDGLFNGFIWNCEILSKYVEVLERNESSFKVKFSSPAIGEKWNFTKEDLSNYCGNIWSEIADYMGATCTQTDDGKYWIVTMNKK
ncbi:MAG: hypothetical protein WC165_04000 [Dysgonamonadaceae bacterium]